MPPVNSMRAPMRWPGRIALPALIAVMLCALTIVALPRGPVLAQMPPPPTYMADQFRHDCQQPEGEGRDRCINYLGGILDLQRQALRLGAGNQLFCPPLFISADQARKAYLAWAEKNPYMIVGPPIVSIVQAFQQSYQCKN